MQEDYTCPVCGKHHFDSLDEFDACPVCDWESNDPQFHDHDMSDGKNALSVNDYRVYYQAVCTPSIKADAKALQRLFMKERWDIKELSRDWATGSAIKDFEMMLPALEYSREKFVSALKQLLAKAG